MQSTENKDGPRITDSGRIIGPKEALAIDTAPFDGLGKHYYQLWLRGSDTIDGLEAALAAERDRADRAEARIAELERPRSLHLYADECTGGYFLAEAGEWEERTLHRFIQTVQSPRILSEATA